MLPHFNEEFKALGTKCLAGIFQFVYHSGTSGLELPASMVLAVVLCVSGNGIGIPRAVIWDMMPCMLVQIYQLLGKSATYIFHL